MTVQFEPVRLGAPDSFSGAKVMVFLGQDLLVIRRDHTPGIPWPGYLDWPGGGRDTDETPEACALRETREEVGLHLDPAQLTWRHLWQGQQNQSWFFCRAPCARGRRQDRIRVRRTGLAIDAADPVSGPQ